MDPCDYKSEPKRTRKQDMKWIAYSKAVFLCGVSDLVMLANAAGPETFLQKIKMQLIAKVEKVQ